MNYFAISALVNTISCLWLFLFIFFSPQKSKTNSTFYLFLLFVALWAGFQFLWLSASNTQTSLFFSRLSNVSALFISSLFLHFTLHLINEFSRAKKLIFFIHTINIILVPIGIFTDLLISGVYQNPTIQYYPIAGKLFPILVFEYFLMPSYALYRIYINIKKSKTDNRKLKMVFWGILIAFLGSLMNFPACYKIPIYPYGNIFIPALVVFISYGILRYQLMDIRIIIQKNLIYTILVILISLLYFLSIFIIEHYFQTTLGYKSFLVSLIFALVISLIFIPLRNAIQSFIEKALYKGNYLEIAQQNEQLRKEVAQTERLKSIAILASGIAHEIKNPLTPLKTFSEFLPNKLDDKEFLKKFSPIIAQEVARIDKLVHELLDFAKPSPVILKATNVHNIVNDTLEYLSNNFIKTNISIIKEYKIDNNLHLNLDANLFKQALLNIFLNAIDAMPNGGTLSISTQKNKELHYQIRIQDTGYGIDPKDIPHIFDPFFTKKDHGTGLGLSVTHEIIKNHNGRIFVESKKGLGTTFIIELPVI
jgi:signal transduction histidine kinase